MSQSVDVSIVIVNWNGRHWLEQCLPALTQQTYPHFETVIVDNGSTDDSVEWLQQFGTGVRVLRQSKNLGFALANNIGIRATTSPFIVTLNNDTRPAPGWLEALVTAVSHPNTGMAAAAIRQWQQPHLLDSAGIEVDKAGIAWQRHINQPVSPSSQPEVVFGPSAAAALYRREMLDEIGLFDEDFFAYYEDVDLAWRAQIAGWQCLYVPNALVDHWHSATAVTMSDKKQYLLGRNKIWTLLKNLPSQTLWRTLPVILLYDILSVGYQIGRTKRLAALHGRIDAWKNRHIALAKRPSHIPTVPLSPITPPWRHRHKQHPTR